jgi:toxin HigB-1
VVKRWVAFERQAVRKLEQMEWSARLEDLRVPPGNRLEALKVRRGQYSIRINDQFRLCFRWVEDGAYDVEIVDYHWEEEMIMRRVNPVTPGEMLEEEFLKPLGITKYRLAKDIGVPPGRIKNEVS